MLSVTTTTTLLLEGLRDETNQTVWREFDQRYRPILQAFARRLGLGAEDASDVAQQTLVDFVRAYRAGKSRIWDEEHRHVVVEQAMGALREQTRTSPETLKAFELLVIDGHPAGTVAKRCGMEVAEVYRIKNRLTGRLRELLTTLDTAYADAL